MTKRHVMLVISSLGGGGAERVIVDLAGFLVAHDCAVTLMTLEGEREDRYSLSPSVRRIRLNIMWASSGLCGRIVSTVRRMGMIRRQVREVRPDVVVSFIDMTNVRVLLALAGTKTPVVVSERIDPRHHRVGKAWDILRRLSYRLAARVVVQTESVANWAREWLPEQRIAIIPNAVRPFGADGEHGRPAGMPRERVVIGIGRLDRQKGFDVLIAAFARSRLADGGWSLVILGEGEARAELDAQIRDEGLAGRVFLPGQQRAPEQWLRHADIFVLSSRYEGFPNVLIEAMQCGAASIAFDCQSGPSEIIRHEHDGLLIPAGSVDALSCALCRLADEKGVRVRLGEAAKSVAERFSRNAVYGKWELLCENVITKGR